MAAVMMAAVSCDKEIPAEAPVGGDDLMTIVAEVGGGTRTAVGVDDGAAVKVVWEGVETIRLFDGTVNKDFVSEDIKGTASAVFTETDAAVDFTGTDYLAAYPLNAYGEAYRDGAALKRLWLKAEQNAVEGSFDPDAHVMVSYAEAADDATLSFRNTMALLKLTVGNENVSEISLTGAENEIMAGNFDIADVNADPTPVVHETAPENYMYVNKVALKGDIRKDGTYYLAVFPQTFAAGFTLSMVIDGVTYHKTTTKSYELQRNSVFNLETVAINVSYKDLYFKPKSGSAAEGEWFAAWAWGNGVSAQWFILNDTDGDGIHEGRLPQQFANVKFFKMAAVSAEPDFNMEQTGDLVLPEVDYEVNNCYVADAVAGEGPDPWMSVAEAREFTLEVPMKQVYFKPDQEWKADGARFAAYLFGEGNIWVDMEDSDGDGIYEAEVPAGYANVIFCRMNPETTENNWDNKLAQTADLTMPSDENNCYVLEYGQKGLWMTVDEAKVYVPAPPTPDVKEGCLYLKPNDNWLQDNARFAAYFFGNGETWVDMTEVAGGYYECQVPEGFTKVIFCRMNPGALENKWDNKWNQTSDLDVPADGTNLYTVPAGTWDKGDGTWSTLE